jgi:hypothetical protein
VLLELCTTGSAALPCTSADLWLLLDAIAEPVAFTNCGKGRLAPPFLEYPGDDQADQDERKQAVLSENHIRTYW